MQYTAKTILPNPVVFRQQYRSILILSGGPSDAVKARVHVGPCHHFGESPVNPVLLSLAVGPEEIESLIARWAENVQVYAHVHLSVSICL